jgi:hypothetical protein
VYGEERGPPVVFTAHHTLELEACERALDTPELIGGLGGQVFGLLFLEQLDEHLHVLEDPARLGQRAELGLEPLELLDVFLCGLLVVPEVRPRHAPLDFFQIVRL